MTIGTWCNTNHALMACVCGKTDWHCRRIVCKCNFILLLSGRMSCSSPSNISASGHQQFSADNWLFLFLNSLVMHRNMATETIKALCINLGIKLQKKNDIQCKIEFDISLYCATLLLKIMLMTQQIQPGFIHY